MRRVLALCAALGILLFVVAPARARRPAMRGVVEGYYGPPWSGAARREVIRFIGAHGLTTFLYAPKNDERHRERWREPYSRADLKDFRRTVRAARRAGVRFIYGLSPGLDICYSCPEDLEALRIKLGQLGRAGISRFALLFDDTPPRLSNARDEASFGGTDESALARAQAQLTNETVDWLRRNRLGRLAVVVPTIYSGTECRPYHDEIAGRLERSIKLGWTGTGVFSPTLSAAHAHAFRACLQGRGVVLWDNFPVNDTLLSNNLHLGPLTGRDPALPGELAGYLLNPMTQAHASLIALGTAAAYLRHPRDYDPEKAWRTTLREVGGRSALAVLAAQTRSSFLDLDDARALAANVDAVAATYDGSQWPAAVDALEGEIARQAAAADALPRELAGMPLGTEISPWVAELGAHAARGRDAVTLLRAMKPGASLMVAAAGNGAVRLSGRVVPPQAEVASALGDGFLVEAAYIEASTARPDVLGYLDCLGDVLGPAIRLCPEFGLNVHGKRLYFVIESVSNLRVVTGRSVHDRLVRLVASRYAAWLARREAGADRTTISVNGSEVSLTAGTGGGFGFTIPEPVPGRLAVLIRTDAGEQTAVGISVPEERAAGGALPGR